MFFLGSDFRIRMFQGRDQVLTGFGSALRIWIRFLRTGSGFSDRIGLARSKDKKKMKLTDIGFHSGNSIGYWIKNLVRFFGYCAIEYVSINFNSKTNLYTY